MSTISVSLPSDGQTIDAADYNVPINTIVADYNGNVDSNNIKASGIVPNNVFTGTGTSWARQTFVPTLTNFTLGNGTMTAEYIQTGKQVTGSVYIACGSTTAFGTNPTFTLPVTAATRYGTRRFTPAGLIIFHDFGSAVYYGRVMIDGVTSYGSWFAEKTDDVHNQTRAVNATTPMTIASGDTITVEFSYEAA